MFGRNTVKVKKEKTKYWVYVLKNAYQAYEYRLLDNGVVELRTNQGLITLMPGTPCMIHGGKWEKEKVE